MSDTPMTRLGALLRVSRIHAGYSKEAMAREFQMTVEGYRDLEEGDAVPDAPAREIAIWLWDDGDRAPEVIAAAKRLVDEEDEQP